MKSNKDTEGLVYRLHAEICQTLANPKRLKIINILRDEEVSAAKLLEILQVPKANLSQQMGVLRQKGIVEVRREGNKIYYRLSRPKILKAYDLMRELLFEVIEEQQKLLKEYGRKRKA